MSDLKEIRERHERECAFITGRLGLGAMNIDLAVTMADRALLLAEVDRLRAIADAFDAFRQTCDDRPLMDLSHEQARLWDEACDAAELRKEGK
jgi:hypothetical protein